MIFVNCHLQTYVKKWENQFLFLKKILSRRKKEQTDTSIFFQKLQNIQLFVEITFMLAAWNNVCRFASSATVYRTMMMMMMMMMKKMTMMIYCSGHRDNYWYSRTYGPDSNSSAYPNDDHNSNSNANSDYDHTENSNVNLNNDHNLNSSACSNYNHSGKWSKMHGYWEKMYG